MTSAVAEREALVVGVLGPIVTWSDQQATPVQGRSERVLLAHLALSRGRAVPVETLIRSVWGEEPPRSARNALQVKISRIRQRLPAGRAEITFIHDAYTLEVAADGIDALRYSQLAAGAESSLAVGQVGEAEWCLHEADLLWRGAPLAGLEEDRGLDSARRQLIDDHLRCAELRAELVLAGPTISTTDVARLRQAVDLDPFRGRSRMLLMRMLDRGGRRAEALHVYHQGRQVLAEEMGVDPPSEVQELFAVLLDDERREGAARPVPSQAPGSAYPSQTVATARWMADVGEAGTAARIALRAAPQWLVSDSQSDAARFLDTFIARTADVDERLRAWAALLADRPTTGAWFTAGATLECDDWMLLIHTLRSCVRRGDPRAREALLKRLHRRSMDKITHRSRLMRLLAEQVCALPGGARMHSLARGVRLADELGALGEVGARLVALETTAELAEATGRWADAESFWCEVASEVARHPEYDRRQAGIGIARSRAALSRPDTARDVGTDPVARAVVSVRAGRFEETTRILEPHVVQLRRAGQVVEAVTCEALMVAAWRDAHARVARDVAVRITEEAAATADARARAAAADSMVLTARGADAQRRARRASELVRREFGVRSLLAECVDGLDDTT